MTTEVLVLSWAEGRLVLQSDGSLSVEPDDDFYGADISPTDTAKLARAIIALPEAHPVATVDPGALSPSWESVVLRRCETEWSENFAGEIDHVRCALSVEHDGQCVGPHGERPPPASGEGARLRVSDRHGDAHDPHEVAAVLDDYGDRAHAFHAETLYDAADVMRGLASQLAAEREFHAKTRERLDQALTPPAAVADPDTVKRTPGCECHQEEGDSPCRVHGDEGTDPRDAATVAFDEIATALGCPTWDYPAQLVRDVKALVARADAAAREADRWRYGVPVEGDYVCPDSLRADAAERRAEVAERRGRLWKRGCRLLSYGKKQDGHMIEQLRERVVEAAATARADALREATIRAAESVEAMRDGCKTTAWMALDCAARQIRALAAPTVESFCACGRRRGECDGSRAGCAATARADALREATICAAESVEAMRDGCTTTEWMALDCAARQIRALAAPAARKGE